MAEAASPEQTGVAPDNGHDAAQKARRQEIRRTWLLRLALAVAILGILWGAWYLLIGRNYVSTDNAYVNAEMAQVTPLMSAQAVEVRVSNTDSVKRGDILVRLDASDAKIAIAQAEADLAEARRKFRQASATSDSLASQVKARDADIVQARSDLEKARIDLARRERLADSGAVSGEELTQARNAFAAAKATLAQAESTRAAAEGEYAASEALVRGSSVETDPAVLAAKARLESAKLDLERTVIRAPIDGIVTKRQVQVGQRVAQGSPIMTIVPVSQVYVDANFKERQLRRVKVGMPAEVTADIYGSGVVYHGRVVGLSGGTGASMALIPAQNATGNWIKVVQRLPVRIELDPKELAEHPLRVGLSTEVEIHLSGD
ncbi:MAG: EmrA/EmrK family multidrug efflux transporter periplasmic adaptor subunit [Novosphingobium sp.]|nr:EmrA/EmrK family multidrug efflux transporter periplasmic adaptor subunit [Novosphingobium sp.]